MSGAKGRSGGSRSREALLKAPEFRGAKHALDYVRRTTDGVPVADATKSIFLEVLPQDVACAIARDPQNCVLANALKRVFYTPRRIFVFRSLAYVETKYYGKMRLERYQLSYKARREIEAFDRTGDAASFGEDGFYLNPPRYSMRLKRKPEPPKGDKPRKNYPKTQRPIKVHGGAHFREAHKVVAGLYATERPDLMAKAAAAE